jgi:hypothetical protein
MLKDFVFSAEANKCFSIYMFTSEKLTNALKLICFSKGA